MPRTLTPRNLLLIAALSVALGSAAPWAAAQDDALIKKGQAVYAAQKCSTCHSVAGDGRTTSPLDGVGKKLGADDIRAWIVDPKTMTTKTKSTKKPMMPARYAKLPPGDLDALVAYMQSLK